MKVLATNPMDFRTKEFTEKINNFGQTYYKPIDLKLFDTLKRMAFFEITEFNDCIYNDTPFRIDNYYLKMKTITYKIDYMYYKNLYLLSDGKKINDKRHSRKIDISNLISKTIKNDGNIFEFEIKKINYRQKLFYFKIYLFEYNNEFIFLTDNRRYSKRIKMKSLKLEH